jgi:hypothetical protein
MYFEPSTSHEAINVIISFLLYISIYVECYTPFKSENKEVYKVFDSLS